MITAANRIYTANRITLANLITYALAVDVVAATHLTFANYETELARVISDNAIAAANQDDFVDWVFFNVAAFNLADDAALETALSAENVLLISDLNTYGAAYTP